MRLRQYRFVRPLCARCPSFVASLVISFTFVACNPTSPAAPTLPVEPDDAAFAVNAADPCPSILEACAAGRALLESE